MRRLWVACVIIALGIFGLAPLAAAADRPWETDTALLDRVFSEMQSGGFPAVKPHAAAMKKALARAPKLFPGVKEGGVTVVLTDGQAETLAVTMGAVAKQAGDVTALQNPYPLIGLFLGGFYVETGKYTDAVKALDAGLALSPLPKERLGQTVPDLLAERGIALGKLKRWKEALATYDGALQIGQLTKSMRAKLHRGRGFVLIEMGQLDAAEAAYKASLKFAPGDQIATGELAYIAGLRGGQKPTESMLVNRR